MTSMPHSFDPASADPRDFRTALGRFCTGVTVVTCDTGTGPLGITANSFSSVSLDPPLVLWSPAKSSSRYPFYIAAQHFAIHVLGEEQRDLCQGFARSGDIFDTLPWTSGDGNTPLIEGCLSRFECRQVALHDAGDHSIVIGEVTRVTTREGRPLAFQGGGFGAFSPLA
ncbi:flavin reductase family protein [Tropicibacter naphthalenivorans]|uniref:p-hydroxyphenylacetate 3-hydroxylase, reductase component n=1 Tax=Tropicibacter naphthalenivorans TaxID=441103 RepID=A0A0P1GBT8_9RHOB|nr:flavin reductase family protein [Tropicibacter naphthalenivorans]CUH78781.1 p-hydroxyphenylacetate 3-hydroxylase, reductase component [Tropicibacter naphthalenivorans]SMC81520.1 NADH-FMN oxidoreductase RutF, flavin reductase (DIM6/NTAB) family [Tropicibacter naphthalenivorans]